MSVVLDAGALIALERNDRALWAALGRASRDALDVIVPTTVLAQVWRNRPSQARLSRALAECVLAPFDPHARFVGELCRRAGTADICDAHVAVVVGSGDWLFTSDPVDMARLLDALRKRPIVVRC